MVLYLVLNLYDFIAFAITLVLMYDEINEHKTCAFGNFLCLYLTHILLLVSETNLICDSYVNDVIMDVRDFFFFSS